METEEAAGIDVGSEPALDAEVEAEVAEVEVAEAEVEEAEADTTAAEAGAPESGPDSYFKSEAEAEEAIDVEAVAAEDARKPLTDQQLVTLLEQKGIKIARRTVAKYRQELRIAPASGRKRLFGP